MKKVTNIEDKTLEVIQKILPSNTVACYVALGEIYPFTWKEIVKRSHMQIADSLIKQAEKQLNSEFHKSMMNREKV